jgi:ribosomal protein S18 acetylase RimI-like enzyme
LEVRESNQIAIGFYLKQGFKYQGGRKNNYRQPKENALIFSLDLTESLVKEKKLR